jgi:cyclopropane fatty-acyl-phospholipid synthase-like methyltransferase
MAILLGSIRGMGKTWKETITPHLNKVDRETKKIFNSFEKEKKSKNLTSTAETNQLWRSKYKTKLDNFLAKTDEEYKKIWNKFYLK